jgi:anhydro-N-acetylmuramic acid kinase
MSGTSADGVDVALVAVEGHGLEMTARLLRHHHRPYPPELKREIFAFRGGDASVDLARLARLGRGISLVYAAAVNEALLVQGLSGDDLSCVAAHGQTLYHDPPLTIQWFDPSIVAAEVGCPVVSDFRRADCAAGGQGAPLVPFADYLLFRHPTRSRVLLNIGGIANITFLPAGCMPGQVIAFDTGPGNCISDRLVRTLGGAGDIDEGGRLAGSGKALENALDVLMRHPYFGRHPPKSTDGPEMIEAFAGAVGDLKRYTLPDLLATACAWTTASIDRGIRDTARLDPSQIELIAAGGGVRNGAIVGGLQDRGYALRTTDEYGIPPDAREAMAFALLGAATLDGVPSNVPSVTGARRAVVLGSITPRP